MYTYSFISSDGDSSESDVLGKFYGDNVPPSVHATTNAVHLLFTSDATRTGTGFKLHWAPGKYGAARSRMIILNPCS